MSPTVAGCGGAQTAAVCNADAVGGSTRKANDGTELRGGGGGGPGQNGGPAADGCAPTWPWGMHFPCTPAQCCFVKHLPVVSAIIRSQSMSMKVSASSVTCAFSIAGHEMQLYNFAREPFSASLV